MLLARRTVGGLGTRHGALPAATPAPWPCGALAPSPLFLLHSRSSLFLSTEGLMAPL